jgi:hypothetical protein
MPLKVLHRSSLALALWTSAACAVSSGSHRLDVAPVLTSRSAGLRVNLIPDSAAAPRGDQIVAGWMGSVLGGFLAWRLFDEPDGQHSAVHNGWGYTPRALTALAVGSHVGTTTAVWARGRAIGSKGSLLFTAVGAALPTIPLLKKSDDPLLMLKVVALWAPLQGYMGYTGYRVGHRSPDAPVADEVVIQREDRSRPRRSIQVIAREELKTASYTNAFDAVSQLRPNWLAAARQRSPTEREAAGAAGVLVVYMDGTRLGALETLRLIPLSDVGEIVYYDAREATNLFGTGHPAGAINVKRAMGGTP